MNRKTLSKNLAVVLSLVFTSYQSPVFAANSSKKKASAPASNLTVQQKAEPPKAQAAAPTPAAAPPVMGVVTDSPVKIKNAEKERLQKRSDEATKECDAKKAEASKKIAEFMSACKDEDQERIADKKDPDKKKKGLEECSKELRECSQNSKDEIVFFSDITDSEKQFLTTQPGIYDVNIQIPNPMLIADTYLVSIGCVNKDNGETSHVSEALCFEIIDLEGVREKRPGYIFQPLNWEIKNVRLVK